MAGADITLTFFETLCPACIHIGLTDWLHQISWQSFKFQTKSSSLEKTTLPTAWWTRVTTSGTCNVHFLKQSLASMARNYIICFGRWYAKMILISLICQDDMPRRQQIEKLMEIGNGAETGVCLWMMLWQPFFFFFLFFNDSLATILFHGRLQLLSNETWELFVRLVSMPELRRKMSLFCFSSGWWPEKWVSLFVPWFLPKLPFTPPPLSAEQLSQTEERGHYQKYSFSLKFQPGALYIPELKTDSL